MFCFKFCKLSNNSKIELCFIYAYYKYSLLVSMWCYRLISKLEYTINRNCSRLLSDLISFMNLYILAGPPVVLKLYTCF